MKRINILLVIGGMFCFGLGYMTSHTIKTAPVMGYDPKLIYENDSLKRELSSKDSVIFELGTEVDILEEDIQIREGEISYWGRRCDSLQTRSKK